MKSNLKKFMCLVMSFLLAVPLAACSGDSKKSDSATTLNAAYQYGMAYAPMLIMEEKKLIEECYGEEIEINWQQLNSGSAINEGFIGGTLDMGAMGVAPFISGVASGLPYKMYSAYSSQRHGLMTNDKSIKTLSDIKDGDQIALVNIGSIQHILLSMAAKKELGDAHILDGNIAAMPHPDGRTALESGSVKLHLTSAPYIYLESKNEKLQEINAIGEVWPEGNTFIVGLLSQKVYENQKLYNAIVEATDKAIDYINNNKQEVAELLCENEGVDAATMLEWLNDSACGYSSESKGVLDMASFMEEEGFVESTPKNFSDYAYDNVKGN